jgi:hypothetical protein
MNIKTKYEIGQHIWVVYEANKEVSVYDDYIEWINVDEDGLTYGLKEACIDVKEEDVVLYDEEERLVKNIKEIMLQIREKEKEK